MATDRDYPPEIYNLAQKYMDDTLTESEAKIFLPIIEKDLVFRRALSENVLADFIIRERYNALREVQSCEMPHIFRSREPLLDAMVAETQFSPRVPDPQPLPDPSYKYVSETYSEQGLEHTDSFRARIFRKRETLLGRLVQWGSYGGIVILLVVVAVSMIQHFHPYSGDTPPEAMAQIDQTVDAVWNKNSTDFKRGRQLHSHALSLASGLVRLKLKNGGILILEGPTDLVINDELNIHCNRGHISTYVPPSASGLRITTPFADFIDYGTRFSIQVTNDIARMDVVEGRVQVNADNNSSGILGVGSGTEVNNRRTAFRIKAEPKHYMTADSFEKQLVAFDRQEGIKKAERDQSIIQDKHLLVHLNFNRFSSVSFKNMSITGAQTIPEATRSHCTKSSGILSGEKSLGFQEPQDNVWLKMQTMSQSVTLVATVKIKELKPEGNIIFSNDHFLQESGSILWQILHDGRIQFHITPRDNRISEGYSSPIVITPSNMNVWLTLAVVVDAHRKEIRHYVDGKLFGSIPWSDPFPLNLGNSTIGNSNMPGKRYQNSWFGGDIASFSLFNEAISDTELASLTNSL